MIGIDASRAGRQEKTGTEWYSYHLIEHMGKIDSQTPLVLYIDPRNPLPKDLCLPERFSIKSLSWGAPFLWTQGRLSLEMAFAKPDTLFVPSHAIPFIHPSNTITTVHDVGFMEWGALIPAKDKAYLEWSTRFAVRHASRIIAISEFTKKELVAHFFADPQRVSVVHLGYDEEVYRPLVDKDYLSTLLDSCGVSKPFLLCVGRIDNRKNIRTLLTAFEFMKRDHPELTLVLAGPLGHGGKAIVDLINQASSRSSIKLLGWISEEQKVGLLNGCAAVLFPTLYEGFGLPILEAQSCKAPVVCSNTSSLPEVAGDGALFFEPLIPQDIAEKVSIVLDKNDVREALLEKGLANCKRFSWEKTASQTLDILSAVV